MLGRVSAERQLVLGLILVYLGDALSRLFGQPYVSHPTPALDQRFRVPGLSDVSGVMAMLPFAFSSLVNASSWRWVALLNPP